MVQTVNIPFYFITHYVTAVDQEGHGHDSSGNLSLLQQDKVQLVNGSMEVYILSLEKCLRMTRELSTMQGEALYHDLHHRGF